MSRRVIRSFDAPGQRGLTLIEFMVAIVIGMLLVAAIATLIANQSSNRAEIDKSGRLIENGRYAVGTMSVDLQMAGYWGERGTAPTAPGALPDPCDTSIANLQASMGLHVQGYDSLATLPVSLQACVTNHKPNTDVLVVRRVDPDTSAIETAGTVTWSKLTPGQIYLQTGLNPVTGGFGEITVGAANPSNPATDSATFTLRRRDLATPSSPRRYMVHIYYVSSCSVPVAGSCTGADGGTPIPTLKRVELGVSAGAPAFSTTSIAEGVEDFQVDYFGQDTNADGVPDGDASGTGFTVANWADVVSVRLHVRTRSLEKTGGFTDSKAYAMGTAGAASIPAGEQGYKRHVFVQSVRLVNPSGRKQF